MGSPRAKIGLDLLKSSYGVNNPSIVVDSRFIVRSSCRLLWCDVDTVSQMGFFYQTTTSDEFVAVCKVSRAGATSWHLFGGVKLSLGYIKQILSGEVSKFVLEKGKDICCTFVVNSVKKTVDVYADSKSLTNIIVSGIYDSTSVVFKLAKSDDVIFSCENTILRVAKGVDVTFALACCCVIDFIEPRTLETFAGQRVEVVKACKNEQCLPFLHPELAPLFEQSSPTNKSSMMDIDEFYSAQWFIAKAYQSGKINKQALDILTTNEASCIMIKNIGVDGLKAIGINDDYECNEVVELANYLINTHPSRMGKVSLTKPATSSSKPSAPASPTFVSDLEIPELTSYVWFLSRLQQLHAAPEVVLQKLAAFEIDLLLLNRIGDSGLLEIGIDKREDRAKIIQCGKTLYEQLVNRVGVKPTKTKDLRDEFFSSQFLLAKLQQSHLLSAEVFETLNENEIDLMIIRKLQSQGLQDQLGIDEISADKIVKFARELEATLLH